MDNIARSLVISCRMQQMPTMLFKDRVLSRLTSFFPRGSKEPEGSPDCPQPFTSPSTNSSASVFSCCPPERSCLLKLPCSLKSQTNCRHQWPPSSLLHWLALHSCLLKVGAQLGEMEARLGEDVSYPACHGTVGKALSLHLLHSCTHSEPGARSLQGASF